MSSSTPPSTVVQRRHTSPQVKWLLNEAVTLRGELLRIVAKREQLDKREAKVRKTLAALELVAAPLLDRGLTIDNGHHEVAVGRQAVGLQNHDVPVKQASVLHRVAVHVTERRAVGVANQHVLDVQRLKGVLRGWLREASPDAPNHRVAEELPRVSDAALNALKEAGVGEPAYHREHWTRR